MALMLLGIVLTLFYQYLFHHSDARVLLWSDLLRTAR